MCNALHCPSGKYARIAHTYCFHCPTGKYQGASKKHYCTDCSVGKFAHLKGLSACAYCSAGTYQHLQGKHFCYNCPSGKYQASKGQTYCHLCSPGYANPFTKQAACKACTYGTFQPAYGQTKCNACKGCGAGQWKNACRGASPGACVKCLAGRYKINTFGNGNAVHPDAKKYCLTVNGKCWIWASPCSGSCSRVPMPTPKPAWCPGGARYATSSEFRGALSQLNARRNEFHGKCASRVFDPKYNHCDRSNRFVHLHNNRWDELVLVCDSASGGKAINYSSKWDEKCIDCPLGHYAPTSGMKVCLHCPAGKYARVRHTYCFHCPSGKFAGVKKSSACTDCAPGSHGPNKGLAFCPLCPGGKYQHLYGKFFCYGCTAGKYQPHAGKTTCYTCPYCTDSFPVATSCYSLLRHCVVSQYTKWGKCDKSCHEGLARRTRSITVTPRCGGRLCPALLEKAKCMDRICECKKVRCEFRNKLSTHSCTTYTQMFGHKRNVISSNKVYSSYIHKKHYTTKYGWMVKAPVITPVTTVTKTQLITSRKSGVHTASTVFSGLGAGATCTVSLKARQTDYDWKRTEWLSIRSSGKKYKMLNTNCGFTKQCSHAYQTCKLGYTTVLADSAGRVTIHATQSNGVNYCAYNGYYMYASVTLTCKYSKSSYLKCPHKKTKQMGYLKAVSKAKCPVNGNLPRCN